MRVSTATELLDVRFDHETAIRMIADAGFDAFDYSMFDMRTPGCILSGNHWKEYVTTCRTLADKCGIVCNQAHAPFLSAFGNTENDKELKQWILRSIEIAAIMGADILVIHPLMHLQYGGNEQALLEANIKFYQEIIPYCEKFQIKVALENMWGWDEKQNCMTETVCSFPEVFNQYVDAINSEWIVACLDIGHASVLNQDVSEMIRTMGGRIQALHVHDTDLVQDLHTLPFLQKINYEEVTNALAEIGYKGDFTFEASNFLRGFPNALLPLALRFMRETGQYLANEIERKRLQ